MYAGWKEDWLRAYMSYDIPELEDTMAKWDNQFTVGDFRPEFGEKEIAWSYNAVEEELIKRGYYAE